MSIKKVVFTGCLLSLSMIMHASPLQCQQVPSLQMKECVDQHGKPSKLYGFINMPYALCSKALCKLDQKNPAQAQCSCQLFKDKDWTSLSVSPSSYKTAMPTWNKNGQLLTVQSNYSLANMSKTPNAKKITCQFKQAMPWTNCFGVRCTVNPNQTATCICPVLKNTVFMISGPGGAEKCQLPSNQAWSGILPTQGQANAEFVKQLYKRFYSHSPVI